MTHYIKLAFIWLLSVAMCHGAIAAIGATDSIPSTSNGGHYSTNSNSGGSGVASGTGGEQHASCTCESSAGSNNGNPSAGTWEGGSSRWDHWGSGGGSSKSGYYDGGYENWRVMGVLATATVVDIIHKMLYLFLLRILVYQMR